MIGDAPGDMKAAKANGALFFPVNPGHESTSWKRFVEEGADRFLKGTFRGAYEEKLGRRVHDLPALGPAVEKRLTSPVPMD